MNFYRRWKTPPRVGSNAMSPLASSPFSSPVKVTPSKSIFNRSTNGGNDVMANSTPSGRRVLFSPMESSPKQQPQAPSNLNNGNEFENNNNNIKRVGSVELPTTPIRQMRPDLFMAYRGASTESPIADDSMVLSCDQSLNISMGMNVSAVSTLNDSFRERHIKNSDIEKGLEVVGRQLARQEQLEWREFWDFLDAFVDISTPDGLARLEAYFVEKSDLARAEKSDQAWNFAQLHQYLDLVATGEQQQGVKQSRHGKWSAAGGAGGAATGVMTPYTCVEKSLQVFAKRITKTLINNIGNMVSINDTLLCELKRLKSLIVSFKVSSWGEEGYLLEVDILMTFIPAGRCPVHERGLWEGALAHRPPGGQLRGPLAGGERGHATAVAPNAAQVASATARGAGPGTASGLCLRQPAADARDGPRQCRSVARVAEDRGAVLRRLGSAAELRLSLGRESQPEDQSPQAQRIDASRQGLGRCSPCFRQQFRNRIAPCRHCGARQVGIGLATKQRRRRGL